MMEISCNTSCTQSWLPLIFALALVAVSVEKGSAA